MISALPVSKVFTAILFCRRSSFAMDEHRSWFGRRRATPAGFTAALEIAEYGGCARRVFPCAVNDSFGMQLTASACSDGPYIDLIFMYRIKSGSNAIAVRTTTASTTPSTIVFVFTSHLTHNHTEKLLSPYIPRITDLWCAPLKIDCRIRYHSGPPNRRQYEWETTCRSIPEEKWQMVQE
jgi:hypothetical protein